MFTVGDKVIISKDIFPGSDDPIDIAARGAHGEIAEDYHETLGEGWAGCYAVQTDTALIHVTESEIKKA